VSPRKSPSDVLALLDRWTDISVRAGSAGQLSRGTGELSDAALEGLRRETALVTGDRVVGVVPTAELADWVIDGPLLLRAALVTLADVLDLHQPDWAGRCAACGRPAPCETFERMASGLERTGQPTEPQGEPEGEPQGDDRDA
jgi:hypothetical protein